MPVRIAFAFALLMLPAALAAQQGGIKRVAFIVTDQTGAVIPDALIRVEGDAAKKPGAWITDREGRATAEIVAGDRQFLISAQGFATLKRTIDWETASIGPISAVLNFEIYSGTDVIPETSELVRLTFTITDQTDAVIPGAIILLNGNGVYSTVQARTDQLGKLNVDLLPGIYRLLVKAIGFEAFEEKGFEIKADMHRTIPLALGDENKPCTLPCGGFDQGTLVPTETQSLTDDLALIPTQQLPLPARRIHRKTRRS